VKGKERGRGRERGKEREGMAREKKEALTALLCTTSLPRMTAHCSR
jgi:hypothetical protein